MVSPVNGTVTLVNDDNIQITESHKKSLKHTGICYYHTYDNFKLHYEIYDADIGEITYHSLSSLTQEPLIDEIQNEHSSSMVQITYHTQTTTRLRIPPSLSPLVKVGDRVSTESIIFGTPISDDHITRFILNTEYLFSNQIQSKNKTNLTYWRTKVREILESLNIKDVAFLIYTEIFIHQFIHNEDQCHKELNDILLFNTSIEQPVKPTDLQQALKKSLAKQIRIIHRVDSASHKTHTFFRSHTPEDLVMKARLIFTPKPLQHYQSTPSLVDFIEFHSNKISSLYHNQNPFLELLFLGLLSAEHHLHDYPAPINHELVSLFHHVTAQDNASRQRILRQRKLLLSKYEYRDINDPFPEYPRPSIKQHEMQEFWYLLYHFMLNIKFLQAEQHFIDHHSTYYNPTYALQHAIAHTKESHQTTFTFNLKDTIEILSHLNKFFIKSTYSECNSTTEKKAAYPEPNDPHKTRQRNAYSIKLEDLKDDIDSTCIDYSEFVGAQRSSDLGSCEFLSPSLDSIFSF